MNHEDQFEAMLRQADDEARSRMAFTGCLFGLLAILLAALLTLAL